MPDYDSRYEREREKLLQRMLPPGTGTAVDIGCNDGRFTALLPSAGYGRVVGYDSDAEVINAARAAHPGIEFHNAYDDFSITGRSLTVALELIEHIPPGQQLAFLKSVRSVTRPGGMLFLSTPGRYSVLACLERVLRLRENRLHPYTWWDETHVSVVSYARLTRLLRAAGFDVERRAGFCFAPPTMVRPRAAHGLLGRAGFDIFVVARVAEA